jgi:hypothetical protein
LPVFSGEKTANCCIWQQRHALDRNATLAQAHRWFLLGFQLLNLRIEPGGGLN